MDLVFSGLNNEYQTGCLIIFDNSELVGASPQKNSYYRCEQLTRGSEKHYILFPRIEWILGTRINESVSVLDRLQNNRISALTHFSNIYYEFNVHGHLFNIRLSDGFKLQYNTALTEGIIEIHMDEEFKGKLAKKVLQYNGKDWISEASRVEK